MFMKYRGRKIGILVCLLVLMLVIVSCGKKEKKLQYGPVYGVATGTADFTVEPPDIQLDNIMAPVGAEIDYTSKLVIKKGDDVFSVTVNASQVRTQEPGTYQVEYKFQYGTGVYTEFIKVTITDDENVTISDGESQMMWEKGHEFVVNNVTTGESNNGGNSTGDNIGNDVTTGNNTGNTAGNGTNTGNNNGADTGNNTGANVGNNNGANTGNNTGNNNGNGTGQGNVNPGETTPGGESQPTSKKELITEAGQGVWKDSDIPNAVIELLSGDVVTIRCSTSRYIVATRTDTTTVERDGARYQVSRLVIIFNNGTEQTLETIEKRID